MKLLIPLCFFIISCSPQNQKAQKAKRNIFWQQSLTDQIDWKSWDSKSLNEAKQNNKLIYLTIGYATGFACEKMQREVYDKRSVSELLNQSFVSVRVDREEQPELDSYFLNIQSLIMKFGAWPINIILTPDLKPLFAATLMKKADFTKNLKNTLKAWQTDPQKLTEQTDQFMEKMKPIEGSQTDYSFDSLLIKDFYARYTHRFDVLYGGIRTGPRFFPKFPVNNDMRLLLRHHFQTKEPQSLKMVKKTMATILKSALFDQIEGGFHRYSSSRDWNSPNFEKILIDQAGSLHAMIDLYRFEKNDFYLRKIEKTISFLFRNFSSPLGGFYSSQAASLDGKDGLYYTWNPKELQSSLNPSQWKIFNEHFSFGAPQRNQRQRRSLRLKTSFQKPGYNTLLETLAQSSFKSLKPRIDKKVVTAHNAYLLSALARIAQSDSSNDLKNIIKKNIDFLLVQHRDIYGQLFRRSFGGQVAYSATLNDYVFLIDALIEIYQFSFDESFLNTALKLQKQQDQLFYDSSKGAYRLGQEPLIPAQYVYRDQNLPSGQSMAFWNLIRLSRFFSNPSLYNKAQRLLKSYPDQLKNDPISYSHLLLALDFDISNSKNLVLSGNKRECQQKAQQIFKTYFPYALMSCDSLDSKLPLHKDLVKTSEYLCDNSSCSAPFNSFEETKKVLFQ